MKAASLICSPLLLTLSWQKLWCLHVNSRKIIQTLYSLVNLAIAPPPNKPFGKFFNMDFLNTGISLLQSLSEIRVSEMFAHVQEALAVVYFVMLTFKVEEHTLGL